MAPPHTQAPARQVPPSPSIVLQRLSTLLGSSTRPSQLLSTPSQTSLLRAQLHTLALCPAAGPQLQPATHGQPERAEVRWEVPGAVAGMGALLLLAAD